LKDKFDFDREDYTYEQYENELKRILIELEGDKIDSLDKLIENYEYGTKILKKCEDILKKAELKIQKIQENSAKETNRETTS
jgi:exodeoxyribonuclease VII small subunit